MLKISAVQGVPISSQMQNSHTASLFSERTAEKKRDSLYLPSYSLNPVYFRKGGHSGCPALRADFISFRIPQKTLPFVQTATSRKQPQN